MRLDRRVSLTSYENGGSFPDNNGNYRNDNNGGLPGNTDQNSGNFNTGGAPNNTYRNNGNGGGLPTNNINNNRNNGGQGNLPGNYVTDDNGRSIGNGNRQGGLPTGARQGNSLAGNNDVYPTGGLPVGTRNRNGSGNVTVLLNGRSLAFENAQRPIVRNGTVLLPARAVLNAAGIPFQYSPLSHELSAQGSNGSVRAVINDRLVTLDNGREERMDTSTQSINGTVYVPLRFLNLVTGEDARYDPNRRIVTLNYNKLNRDMRNNGNGNTTGGIPPR